MFRQKHLVHKLVMLALASVVTLSACQNADEEKMRPPAPDPTSSKAKKMSDEEALESFNVTYGAYIKLSDQIYSEGGVNSQRIEGVASGSAADDFKSAASDLLAHNFRTTGSTTIDSVRIQSVENSSGGEILITAYLCADVSAVDVLDSEGTSIVSPERNARTPYKVIVNLGSLSAHVSSRDVWLGDNFC